MIMRETLYCSFCGKTQHEVKRLIAAKSVLICSECVELCNELIYETDETDETDEMDETAEWKEGFIAGQQSMHGKIHHLENSIKIYREGISKLTNELNKYNNIVEGKE